MSIHIVQYRQCDWSHVDPTVVASKVTITAHGAGVDFRAGTARKGYDIKLHLSLNELMTLTADVLKAKAGQP